MLCQKLLTQKNAKGLDLMRRVCDQLNLQEEREYFGLLFNHKKEKVKKRMILFDYMVLNKVQMSNQYS